MSLRNMRREPRRELIEQGIGTVVVAAGVIVDYFVSVWVAGMDTSKEAIPWELWMFIIPLVLVVASFILWGLANLIHAIGEGISNRLADNGLDPRPKKRY